MTILSEKVISIGGFLLTILGAAFGTYFAIEGKIENSAKVTTELMVKEVQSSSIDVISVVLDDIKMQLHTLELEIAELEKQGKPVPDRLAFRAKMMKERIREIELKWFAAKPE